jgi:UDP-N-acetylglucosamine diphosphorylase/glucosamine-1-phosphate N-acetyltransferase
MIVLYDDARARSFEPFATSRPLGEMRAGALLIRERWESVLHAPATAFVSSPHLDGFSEFDAPPALRALEGDGAWLVNTRALPYLSPGAIHAPVLTIGGEVAAMRVTPSLLGVVGTVLRDGSYALTNAYAVPDGSGADSEVQELEGVWLEDVWDVVAQLSPLLLRDIEPLAQSLRAVPLGRDAGATIIGVHPVYVESGATVEPMTVFDTTAGPVLLRQGSHVQAFTRVIGPCYVGRDSVLMADRIAASSIGDTCRVHGELSSSVFIGHANKGHDGFVGHSVLGRWVNLGAGTITSNLKNTYGAVALWTPDGVRHTGMQFLGTLFGDHVKTGIGLRLTTGCVLGAGANVFDAMPPKAVAPFAWGGHAPYATFAADKFVDTASRMMARRHITLAAESRAWWMDVHARAARDTRWPR